MAGIYIHIPYCRQACSYCDFYFTTNLSSIGRFIESLKKEIILRKNFFTVPVETVYFGGGTPSMLEVGALHDIMIALRSNYLFDDNVEVTLEANPENLTREYLLALRKAGINRLSIGLQSFNNNELAEMKRVHHAADNLVVVKRAREAGFSNISVDLIYGTPWISELEWENHLDTVIGLNVEHVSCYQLTIEEKTELHHRLAKGLVPAPDDEKTEKEFLMLVEKMKLAGFIHYEVSNFGKPGYFSKHNSSYWKDKPYLGLGPSAHGYNGVNFRYMNLRNLHTWATAVDSGKDWFVAEKLSDKEVYNDFVLTGLRTIFGVSLPLLEKKLNQSYVNYFQRKAQPYVDKGEMEVEGYIYRLKEESFLFADRISADLFYI